MPSLRIYLLGDLHVLWEGKPILPFPTRQTRALFAYLVTYRQRAHTRAELAGIFWGDFPENRAHRNLNTTLWRLRRALPDDNLLVEGDTIAFNPTTDYWLDVAEFETRCTRVFTMLDERTRNLEKAVSLYRGDFLQGWYDDWALVEAERLRFLYLQALQGLTDCYQAGGDLVEALGCARRLLGVDPLKEDVHRQVMALHASLGQRETALAQFVTCEHILQEEIGIAPAPETIGLAGQIRAGTWSGLPPARVDLGPRASAEPVLPSRPRTPFDDFGQATLVGRETEAARLHDRLVSLSTDGGNLILLEGEAGVGKTHLTREMMRQADSLGFTTLWGTCLDLQAPPPYHGLVEILRAAIPSLQREDYRPIAPVWLAELAPLLPELSPATPLPNQQFARLQEAIVQFLVGLSTISPHLIVIEDLQWADPATLETLCYLQPRLKSIPVLLIATLRPEEVAGREELSRTLASLEPAVQKFRLQRLSADETVTLVCRTLGLAEDCPALARFVHRETDGNPFFVGEVLKSLVEENYLRLRANGRWESPWDWDEREVMSLLPPQGVRQAVQRRLERLSPVSRGVLEAAAVLGRDFSFELLQQVSGQGEQATLEATDDLLRRQLLVEDGDQLGLSHDKIRQIVYQSLSLSHRRSLHRLAGEVLSKLTQSRVEELANHFYLARDYRRALSNCLQAGERAQALYANRSALTYSSWAIECARQVGGDEGGQALVAAYENRGVVWDHLGNYDETLSDYTEMREAAERRGDLAGMSRAIRRTGWVHGDHFGDWERGLKEAQRALELAQQASDDCETARARLDIGAYHNMRGEYALALEYHHAALAGFRALGDAQGEAASLQYLAVAHHFLSQHAQSLDYYQQALALWQQLGERRSAAKTLTNIGFLCISMGRLQAAQEAFEQAEKTLREIEALPALPWVLTGLGATRRFRGQFRSCLEALDAAGRFEQQSGKNPYVQALIHEHRAMALWGLGEREAALAMFDDALALARQSTAPTVMMGILNELGRCLRQKGEVDRALPLHEEALALARQAAFESGEISAQSELGLDRVLAGMVAEGLADLEAAAQRAQGLSDWKRAETLLNWAEGLLAAGQADRAGALAEEGLALAEALGLGELAGWGREIAGRMETLKH